VCLYDSSGEELCPVEYQVVYAVDKIYSDNWNNYGALWSGTFGFGKSSPAWQILGDPDTKLYDVQLTNFVDWTFADSSWVQVNTANEINFGGYGSYSYDTSTPNTTFTPYKSGSYLFQFEQFGFGKTTDSD